MMIREDILGDLLYSRHTFPYLHCGAPVQFPLAVRVSHPSQHDHSLLCLLIWGLRSPKWLGGSSNFQFNGIMVLAFLALELRPLGQQSIGHRDRSKNFVSGLLEVIVSISTCISIPLFLDPWVLAIREMHHILDADSEHLQPPGEPCLSPAGVFHLVGIVTESPKG